MVESINFTSQNFIRRPVREIAEETARIIIKTPAEDRPYIALGVSVDFTLASIVRMATDLLTSAAVLDFNHLVGGPNVLDVPNSVANIVEHPTVGLGLGVAVLTLGTVRELGLRRSVLFGLTSLEFARFAKVSYIANVTTRRN